MNIKDYLRPLVARILDLRVPTKQLTVNDTRWETPAIAQGMTQERVMGCISAAESGETRDLFSLYRDVVLTNSHLQSELMKRKLAVLGDAMSFMPFDRKLQADIDTANAIDAEVSACKGWLRAASFLLDSTLYPVAVIEKTFVAVGKGYRIAGLTPVPYQLLDFTSGRMMIYDVNPTNGQPLLTKHDVDPNRYIVHRGHLLSTPDNWGGPMRSILFWWLLAAMDREWWAKFLEKYGTPFMVGKFRDEEGRSILERAFALSCRLGGLVISEGTSVELKEAAAANSGTAYQQFITICEREMSKLVLGQTMTTEAQPSGLGSGQANVQEGVRQDIRRFDGKMLAETLRDQLITQLVAINRLPGNVPLISLGSESDAKVSSAISLLTSLKQAGLRVTDDGLYALSEKVGLPIERDASAGPPVPFAAAYSPTRLNRPGRIPVEQMDRVAQTAAPDLAKAFRGSLAPIAQIIRDSKSPEECELQIRHFFADWDPKKVNVLVADALTAYAINGTEVR